jgi:cell division protein FtsB
MKHLIYRIRQYATIQNGTIVVAFLIATGWMWGTVQTLQKNFGYQQQVDTLNQQVELEQLRNQNLKFQQQYYSSDEYLELSARQRLNKANPGEKLIILPDSRTVVDKATSRTVAVAPKPSNLAQWLQFFFGQKHS